MKIFVNSRGRSIDYMWHELSGEAEAVVSEPPLYRWYSSECIIDPYFDSIALGQSGPDRLLFAHIKALHRRDGTPWSREIWDTLIWQGAGAEEGILRGIAAQILEDADWLPVLLDQAIVFDPTTAFAVRRDVFDSMLALRAVGDAKPAKATRVARLTAESRRALGRELCTTQLPDADGFQVIVTGNCSLESLTKSGIWRALANGIAGEEDWDERLAKKNDGSSGNGAALYGLSRQTDTSQLSPETEGQELLEDLRKLTRSVVDRAEGFLADLLRHEEG